MNGDMGWYVIKPDQMQVLNAVLILILIPLFDAIIYPFFARFNFLQKPLQRITVGGLFAAGAFFISGFLELAMMVRECVCVCVCKGRPCGIAHGKGQLTGPRGEVPKWAYYPNPASKIGPWHTADRVLLPVDGFRGQLCSRPDGFAERS